MSKQQESLAPFVRSVLFDGGGQKSDPWQVEFVLHMMQRYAAVCRLESVSDDPKTNAMYWALILDGASDNLARMLALQSPPMSNTDREFLEGHCNGNQFADTPEIGDYYKSIAEQAGVDVTGKVYIPSLALFPGDPKAWVSDRGDVVRVAEERGMTVTGAVEVKGRQPELFEPPVDVADDIVQEAVELRIQQKPELAEMDQGELFHQVKQEIKPHWAK